MKGSDHAKVINFLTVKFARTTIQNGELFVTKSGRTGAFDS